ncbi:hypothetical protein JJD41_21445 [Oxynema sp. CENA135]|uniref:hypothetical protein n=1 Tax=Oxynema sp. CENA135 TaxID=984206 RepID=UPI00190A7514|nr:hypothetical protein [Oxynema sp. CENA135]MBK4732408.1 hypothetical protein [Oxynema sp. CENA135]
MKKITILKGTFILFFSLSLVQVLASEVPQPDENGDYLNVLHDLWVVTDTDPNGVNCRMPLGCTFQTIMNRECTGFTANYLEYPIVGTLQYGEIFRSYSSNRGQTFIDRRKLPWVFVGENLDGSTEGCFIRANIQFTRPTLGRYD